MTFCALDAPQSLAMIPPADYPPTQWDGHASPDRMRECAICGAVIASTCKTQKYCSKPCANAAALNKNQGGGGLTVSKAVSKALSVCPYASGAIKMPDGGRAPSAELGF